MSTNDNSQYSVALQDYQGWESMRQDALRYMEETGTDSVTACVCVPGMKGIAVMVIVYRGGSFRVFRPLEDVRDNDNN